MARILLVENPVEYQSLIQRLLGPMHSVVVSTTLSDAKARVIAEHFDLLILEALMPDGSGLEFCANLHSVLDGATPRFIFYSASKDVAHKVAAFSFGAEDYILKPCDPSELRVRIEARLRRAVVRSVSDQIAVGDLRIDLLLHKVLLVGAEGTSEISMTPTAFKILCYFARNEQRVLSRWQLMRAVWPGNCNVLERTVDKHVSALRERLGNSGIRIETVPRLGYRLTKTRPSTVVTA